MLIFRTENDTKLVHTTGSQSAPSLTGFATYTVVEHGN